jgi:hypothetical protein
MSNVLYTKNSKSLLAKLMAEENLSVQHQNVQTAHFDVVNRILVVPIWKEMSNCLYDLFMGHEVGHALWTPTDIDELNEAIGRSNKDFINVIEDVRIEKNAKKKFPGLRAPFYRAYQELHENNFFGTKDKDLKTLGFIDRINIFYKSAMTDFDAQGLFRDDEIGFVNRAKLTESFAEVADLSEEIYNFLKEKQESVESMMDMMQLQMTGNPEEDSADNSVEESEENSADNSDKESEENSADNSDEESEEDANTDGSGKSDTVDADDADGADGEKSSGDGDSKEENNDQGDANPAGGGGGKSGNEEMEQFDAEKEFGSATDKSATESMAEMVDQNAGEIEYLTIPDIDLKKCVVHNDVVTEEISRVAKIYLNSHYHNMVDHTQLYQSVLKKNSAQISYLVKEFEMKKSAQEYASSYESKSGNINTSKIWSYKISDDIFKRKSNVPEGKNHGMVMMIDWSGSMHTMLYQTVVQTIILATFCKRVGIPFDVYTFTDRKHVTKDADEEYREFQTNPENIGKLKIDSDAVLQHVLSGSKNAAQFKTQCNNLLFIAYAAQHFHGVCTGADKKTTVDFTLGGTPLCSGLIILDKVIAEFKKTHGVEKTSFIVLSDGDAGDGINFVNKHGFMTSVRDWNTRKKQQYVVTHARTKKTYVWSTGRKIANSDAQKSQEFLLTAIKDINNTPSIGFFLCDGRYDIGNAVRQYVFRKDDGRWINPQEVSKVKRQMKKDGFVTANDCGFDDYYLLDMRTQKSIDDDLEVDSEMTNAKIAKSFAKFQSGKKTSRQMMNKFVDNIK